MKNHVRHWRKQRDLTLEELAEQSGVSGSQISRIERGEKGWSVDSLEGIARSLNVTPGKLLDGPDGKQNATEPNDDALRELIEILRSWQEKHDLRPSDRNRLLAEASKRMQMG